MTEKDKSTSPVRTSRKNRQTARLSMHEQVLGVVNKEPLHNQVLPYLRQEIIEGKWPPNSRLPEPVLCSRFGISRTPLRDTLRVLEIEGLLTLLPNVGAVITSPSREDMLHKLEVMSALEVLAAELAAERGSGSEKRELLKLHERMMKAGASSRQNDYYELNELVHSAIVEMTGNADLRSSHARLMAHVTRLRHIVNIGEPLNEATRAQHMDLIPAIVSSEAIKARRIMREHMAEGTSRVLKRMPADD